MKNIIQTVKGARDFYPEDRAVHNWLYQSIRTVSEGFGYSEFEGPYLERIDLYAAKSGDELVNQQSFVFPDRGGEMIALRPELTPSLARMVAQRQNMLALPLRWWQFGPFWRYEKPQKGRSREFFQWNIDLIGPTSPEADAEMVAVAATLLKTVGLSPEQVKVYVNNRRLTGAMLSGLGVPDEKHTDFFGLIDRRPKMRADEWDANAVELGLDPAQVVALKSNLANKDYWKASQEMVRLFAAIDALGVREFVEYDPQVIRGLTYYTGTVFEAYDTEREFRAVLGGGRYDNLVGDVGGESLGGVGFAMGDMVIRLLLEKSGCVPQFPASPAPVLVTVFDQQRLETAFALAAELRAAGLKVACYPEVVKLPRQMKYADRIGARFVAIIGPDEAEAGSVTLKDLQQHTQQVLARAEVAQAIQRLLG